MVPHPLLEARHAHWLFRQAQTQRRGTGYFREAIRFFHWPFQDFQQELLEAGELHRAVSKLTWKILTRLDDNQVARIVQKRVEAWSTGLGGLPRETDLVNEIRRFVVETIYEVLFDLPLSKDDYEVYYAGAKNFHDTLKGVGVRSKTKRLKLLAKVRAQVARSEPEAPGDVDITARHYAAVFFATGVMQSVECIAHTLTALHQTPDALTRMMQELDHLPKSAAYDAIREHGYLDQVVKESLRLYPLFGRTARQVSETVTVEGLTIAKGSTLVLDFLRFHKEQWEDGEQFKAERWEKGSPSYAHRELREKHYMPFGTGPRSCPAKAFALCLVKTAVVGVLHNARILIPQNYVHTRRIPWGIPAVVESRLDRSSASAAAQRLLTAVERRLPSNRDWGRIPGLSIGNTIAEMMNNRRSYGLLSIEFLSPLISGAQVAVFYLGRYCASRLAAGKPDSNS